MLAPVVRDRKGEYAKELAKLRKDGFVRVNIDGELHELAEPPKLDKNKKHTIEVYVDRLVKKDGIRQRLTDSIELAAKLAEGIVKISPLEGERPALLREVRLHDLRHLATRRSRRGCSRSTTRTAPARPATASAPRCSSIPT